MSSNLQSIIQESEHILLRYDIVEGPPSPRVKSNETSRCLSNAIVKIGEKKNAQIYCGREK